MVQDMKIMMRTLSRDTTQAELLILFEEYGNVQYCKLGMIKVTGKSKGIGFVEMPRASEGREKVAALYLRKPGAKD